MTRKTVEEVRKDYKEAGQEHVFTFWDSLDDAEQHKLIDQLASIDPVHVNAVFQRALKAEAEPLPTTLAPPPPSTLGSAIESPSDIPKWYSAGLEAIRQGTVGVLLLAGGQGTRLGSSDPKGCYDVGLPSRKSLFQLQAERIKRLETLAGGKPLPWYLMTSGPTRAATQDFFAKNAYFGLDKANVVFFEQGPSSVAIRLVLCQN